MIQFNLLPDVKLAFIKAERVKRLVIGVSILAGGVALGVFILLFAAVNVVQKKNINDLNGDISTSTASLKNTPDLDKILTIQNQLSSLTSLHDKKPMASRIFTFVAQTTPANVTVSSITTDFTAKTVTINGGAPSLDAVNTFIDTLKFTTYTSDKTSDDDTKAFSNVVLSGFTRSKTDASYTITLAYDEAIFDTTSKSVELVVPTTVTTRSVTEQPSVFKQTGAQ